MQSEESKSKRLRIVTGAADGTATVQNNRAATDEATGADETSCPHCFGTGMEIVPEVGARRCRCQTPDHRERLVEAARIPPRYRHCTLQGYQAGDDELSKWMAKAEAQRIIQDYPVIDGRGLILFGGVGVGKTHL